MAESATAKKVTRPSASFARRYGVACVSVTGALLLDVLFHHFSLPHPFIAFALCAIAIAFWYGGHETRGARRTVDCAFEPLLYMLLRATHLSALV
jgi:hypothetical protein